MTNTDIAAITNSLSEMFTDQLEILNKKCPFLRQHFD